jgi:transcriptional regulator NrdR family protein
MRCPKCKNKRVKVVDSRHILKQGEPAIRRRRECRRKTCKHRFTTYEVYAKQDPQMQIIMRPTDGSEPQVFVGKIVSIKS